MSTYAFIGFSSSSVYLTWKFISTNSLEFSGPPFIGTFSIPAPSVAGDSFAFADVANIVVAYSVRPLNPLNADSLSFS